MTNMNIEMVESPAAAVKRLNDQFWNSAYGKNTGMANKSKFAKYVGGVLALLKEFGL